MAQKDERKSPDGAEIDWELHRKRKGRNLAMLIGLIVLVVVFYAVTILKMDPTGGNGG